MTHSDSDICIRHLYYSLTSVECNSDSAANAERPPSGKARGDHSQEYRLLGQRSPVRYPERRDRTSHETYLSETSEPYPLRIHRGIPRRNPPSDSGRGNTCKGDPTTRPTQRADPLPSSGAAGGRKSRPTARRGPRPPMSTPPLRRARNTPPNTRTKHRPALGQSPPASGHSGAVPPGGTARGSARHGRGRMDGVTSTVLLRQPCNHGVYRGDSHRTGDGKPC